MAAFLERVGIFGRWPDARPAGEIERDIDDELAFHLDECARDLERAGAGAAEATLEARRRFGDVGTVRRSCARIQMGERIMLKYVQLGLNVVLLVAVAVLFLSNREARAVADAQRMEAQVLAERLQVEAESARALALAAEARAARGTVVTFGSGEFEAADGTAANLEAAAQSWRRRFHEGLGSWRHGLAVAGEIARLKGPQGAEILARIWADLPVEHREQVMKPFVFGGGHGSALEVLELGAHDPEPSVRGRALLYLYSYAWRDLSLGVGTVEAWLMEWRGKNLDEVIRTHASRWAKDVGAALDELEHPPEARIGPLLALVDHVRTETAAKAGVDLAAILRQERICERLSRAVELCDTRTRERAQTVIGWCASPTGPR